MPPRTGAILFEAAEPVPFALAWQWQRLLQARLLADPAGPEALLLVQHPPCYTLGRGASTDHLGFDPARAPLPLFRIDRGGEVTHHAPGQLVLYPVLNLQRHGADLHLYLRQLEGVVIDLLAELGLAAERQEGLTGVWLEGRKLAAIGVGARRWISQHGLALNVNCSLEGFGAIVPCGLSGRAVGRLSDWIPGITPEQLQAPLLAACARHFALELRPATAAESLPDWPQTLDPGGRGGDAWPAIPRQPTPP
jgi:lipoyl(octanoyl) transferase